MQAPIAKQGFETQHHQSQLGCEYLVAVRSFEGTNQKKGLIWISLETIFISTTTQTSEKYRTVNDIDNVYGSAWAGWGWAGRQLDN